MLRSLRPALSRIPTHIPLLYRPRLLRITMAASPSSTPPPKRLKSDIASTNGDAPAASSSSSAVPNRASTSGPSTAQKATVKQPKKRKIRRHLPDPYSPGDVLFHDVRDLLGHEYVDQAIKEGEAAWEYPAELETSDEEGRIKVLRVSRFTVGGESLSVWPQEGTPQWAIVVPFAHPGDLIKVKLFKHDRLHSFADLLEILEYNEETRGGEGDRRKHPNAGCKYFGTCGGCQLQPLPYALQLAHKKRTVELAYTRFSGLDSHQVPVVRDTIASPKQWGYRTKITPHFDAIPKHIKAKIQKTLLEIQDREGDPSSKSRVNGHAESGDEDGVMSVIATSSATGLGPDGTRLFSDEVKLEDIPEGGVILRSDGTEWTNQPGVGPTMTRECKIGFEKKGKPGILDIEECPIAAPVLNTKLTEERARVKSSILSYKKGATLLLRSSLPPPFPLPTSASPFDSSSAPVAASSHVAITDHRAPIYERVGPFLFSFAAGSFFQNNNSILLPLVDYVRDAIFPPDGTARKPTRLVDAYCGSGLFGITLSPYFEKVAGVEISQDSITAAKRNAEMNGLEGKTTWLCGKAEEIFGGLGEQGFEGGESCMVVDPPRKGCDEQFLRQLLAFKPLTVVYVSCNVHTQARDIGWVLKEGPKEGVRYALESLRGFDLFPQTAHVESVAVLRLQQE